MIVVGGGNRSTCASPHREWSQWWSGDDSVSVSSSPGPRVCEDRWHEDRSGGHGHRWHAGALRSVSPHTSTSTTALFSPHLNPSQPLALLSRRGYSRSFRSVGCSNYSAVFVFPRILLERRSRTICRVFEHVRHCLVSPRSEIHIHGSHGWLYFMKSFNRKTDIQNIRNQNLVRQTFLKNV